MLSLPRLRSFSAANHPGGHIFPTCTKVPCGLWGPQQSKNEGHLDF